MIIVASISKLQRRRHGVDAGVSTFVDCMACTVQMRSISTEWSGPLGCLCVGHDREPHENGGSKRDAVWGQTRVNPKNSAFEARIEMPLRKGHFWENIHVSTHWLLKNVAEWLACWTQVQKGLGSRRSRDADG